MSITMKRFFIILAAAAVLAAAAITVSSCSKMGSLVGTKWFGADVEFSLSVEFTTEDTCMFQYTDLVDGEVDAMSLPYVYEKPNISIAGIINGTVNKSTMVLHDAEGYPMTLQRQ